MSRLVMGARGRRKDGSLQELARLVEDAEGAYARVCAPRRDARFEASCVESVRRLAEVVVRGEARGEDFVEFLVEKSALGLLVALATAEAAPPRVQQQVLQTVAILVQ